MKLRPWIAASAFVWTLAGAVALASYSGRSGVQPVAPEAEHDHAAHAGKPHIEAPVTPLQSIEWESSFEAAMQRARAEGKPIMIDFYADWCGPCKMMDQQVYPDPRVIQQSRNWVSVKINGEQRPDVMQAYGITGYPTILWVQSNGQPVAASDGFVPAPQFAAAMQNALGRWQVAPRSAQS